MSSTTSKPLTSSSSSPHHDSHAVVAIKDIVAGSIRGGVQVLVGHPLDTMKVRLQAQNPNAPLYSGIWDCFRKTVAEQGFRSLYKGASSPASMCAVYSAALFLAYGQTRKVLGMTNDKEVPLWKHLLSSAITGGAAAVIECPMELVKAKVQVARTSVDVLPYKGALDCGRYMIKHHGVASLYQGMGMTLLRNSAGSMCYFTSYNIMRQQFTKLNDNKETPAIILTSGGLAGMMYWLSIYPVDVIKTRVQTDAILPAQRQYTSSWHCARHTFASAGIRGLFAGFGACMVRSFPTNAISFLAYENSRAWLDRL